MPLIRGCEVATVRIGPRVCTAIPVFGIHRRPRGRPGELDGSDLKMLAGLRWWRDGAGRSADANPNHGAAGNAIRILHPVRPELCCARPGPVPVPGTRLPP